MVRRPIAKKSVTIGMTESQWSVEITRSGDSFSIALIYGDKDHATHACDLDHEENKALLELLK